MNLDFQQGIVTYPVVGPAQSFLTFSGGFVTLDTANGRTDVAFAHGDSHYLLTESTTVPNAWGPLPANTDCWLYWDIHTRTGVRTFGFTTLAPVYGATPPSSPVSGQLWFNPAVQKMYEYTGPSANREVIRVFAAKINNTTFTPLGSGFPSRPYSGTQAGLTLFNIPTGRILYDDVGNPIRKVDGTFFTTESDIFADGSPVNVIRLEANVLMATAREPMAKFHVVKYTEFGRVNLASYDDTGSSTIAMLMEDLDTEETGTICLQGHVTNPAWNWSTVGAKLWISTNGALTDVDPHVANSFAFPTAYVAVARVVSPTSVIFDQGLGGKGDRGEPGLSGGVSLASTTTFGVVRLSTPPSDVDNPVVVGVNDPVLNNKVLRAGDTMTGLLVLSGNPVVNLGAATKQYVDTRVLNDLADVNTTGAVLNNTLVFDGTDWLPGVIQGGGFLFQVGSFANPNHIHWALMTISQAQTLIQTTDPELPVAGISQPSVVLTSSENGSVALHTHDITVYFDYARHTFIVTDITNNTGPGGTDIPHAGYLVGGPPQTPSYDLTLACSDTTTELVTRNNAAFSIAPRNFTVSSFRADLIAPSTLGTVVAEILIDGSPIATITILQGDLTGELTQTELILQGARITVNILSGGVAAVGLVVTLVGGT